MQAAEDETKLTTLDNKAELVYGGPVACHQVHSREVLPFRLPSPESGGDDLIGLGSVPRPFPSSPRDADTPAPGDGSADFKNAAETGFSIAGV